MRGMRRKENKINTIVNTKADKSGRDIAVMTIIDEESIIIW